MVCYVWVEYPVTNLVGGCKSAVIGVELLSHNNPIARPVDKARSLDRDQVIRNRRDWGDLLRFFERDPQDPFSDKTDIKWEDTICRDRVIPDGFTQSPSTDQKIARVTTN